MSRARSHLRHYGDAGKPSEFLDHVAALQRVQPVPLARKAAATEDWIVPTSDAILGAMDADQLNRFERCKRRFLYTYLLGLEGRQRQTPFVKTHDCVYETIRAAKEHSSPRDKDWLLEQLEAAWKRQGPVDHAYEKDYRKIAQETISNFHAACEGLDFQEVETLVVDLAHGKVEVNPDQIARLPDGTIRQVEAALDELEGKAARTAQRA